MTDISSEHSRGQRGGITSGMLGQGRSNSTAATMPSLKTVDQTIDETRRKLASLDQKLASHGVASRYLPWPSPARARGLPLTYALFPECRARPVGGRRPLDAGYVGQGVRAWKESTMG